MSKALTKIVKNAASEVWKTNISVDYTKGRLRREASLQSSFYYHLRQKIGDSTLDFFDAAIYPEYHYKGKRVDLAVVSGINSSTPSVLAIFEFKYKNITADTEFLKDVVKIIEYISDEDECIFYLGFIQEAEFADLDDNFTWLNQAQLGASKNRLVEMTGGLYRPKEEPVWSFREVK